MRFFSADFVFPGHSALIKNGVIVTNDQGMIEELLDPSKEKIPDSYSIEKFDGIICPGFINAHCHLELSHLKGKLTKRNQLSSFIAEVIGKRDSSTEEIELGMIEGDAEMYKEGIVAVGDISNNSFSVKVKKSSKIYYHTFVELFDVTEERSDVAFQNGKNLRRVFSEAGMKASLVPHAPYSVTRKLLRLITAEASSQNDAICIHNQETESENEMFESESGKLLGMLKKINPVYNSWRKTGESSLAYLINESGNSFPIQLVHNTFSRESDFIEAISKRENLFWCLCPNANIFIEDKLPSIDVMMKNNCRITIGTDSLASNDALSVLSEIKTIHSSYPEIGLNNTLEWATINGACFLKIDKLYGSFEKGKTPGINHIDNIDLANMSLTQASVVHRLL